MNAATCSASLNSDSLLAINCSQNMSWAKEGPRGISGSQVTMHLHPQREIVLSGNTPFSKAVCYIAPAVKQ